MTKFDVLAYVFDKAHSILTELEYEEVGIAGMIERHFMNSESKFINLTIEECVNAFFDDANEVYTFGDYTDIVIGTTLITVSKTEWGTHISVRKEAYINIARASSYEKRIK